MYNPEFKGVEFDPFKYENKSIKKFEGKR